MFHKGGQRGIHQQVVFPRPFMKGCTMDGNDSIAVVQQRVEPSRTDSSGIRILTNPGDLETISPWWKKWQYRRESHYEYFTGYLLTRPGAVGPYVAADIRNGGPKAIMAGYLSASPISLYVGTIRVFHPTVRLLIVPTGGILGEVDERSMRSFAGEIRRLFSAGDIDMVNLYFVEQDSLIECQLFASFRWYSRAHYLLETNHRRIVLPDTVEGMLEQVQAKKRKWLAEWRSLLRNNGNDVRLEVFTGKDAERCISLAGMASDRSWKRGKGIDAAKSYRSRYVRWAAEKDRMRGYILYIQGTPAAFWIGSRFGDTFYLDFCDFDPTHRKYSLGHLSLIRVFEDLIRNTDLRIVDFANDDEPYKKLYGNRTTRERTVLLFAPTPKGYMLSFYYTGTAFLQMAMIAMLKNSKVYERMKKWQKTRYENRAMKQKSIEREALEKEAGTQANEIMT